MKNWIKSLLFSFSLLVANAAMSQMNDFNYMESVAGNATISSTFCLTLDSNDSLHEYYVADISHLGFTSEKEAQKAFGMKQNNRISYIVDFSNQRVFARIYNDRIPQDATPSVAWWNDYLTQVCSNY